ncbi:MAG: acyl-CoA dehydrogenase family protein [Candidatus Rokubacteria bacterium]|nr:acyl-CoA dehydrogenase family protein [Candidatus Rokubacteria bacterium]
MDHPVLEQVRAFVERDVRPAAPALEHADRYPHELVARMRELGLFGALVPEAYGGLGLDVTTYAKVVEALCRGFMSLAGVINSHTMAALIVLSYGTDEQRRRLLPRFARGEARGGLCLTEPHAGSDVQAILTVARRRGDEYVLTGTKMFVTNGREGNTFALLALTDPKAEPRHKGMSCFIVEKGAPGLTVVKSIRKLGYKGVDTAELLFEDFAVPAANLVGGVEGRGFKHVMGGLETGRINIAARAVGVAQAAYDDALEDCARGPVGEPPPALADMAATLEAARLLTYWAAGMKDRGERCDLEAGMAKLYASEAAQELAVAALRVHGAPGTTHELNVERYYRDTPLMIIGEGTNEIQRTIIARQLVDRYGERLGALTSREGEAPERRQMVLAVRQFVEKEVVPAAQELDAAGAYPGELVAALAELGVLGALVPQDWGGLGLDARTFAMLVEELARGSAALAAVVATHAAVTHALACAGTEGQKRRWLPALARGEPLAAAAFRRGALDARADGPAWRLDGATTFVDNATRAALFLVQAREERHGPACFLVERATDGVTVGRPAGTIGERGLDHCALILEGARVPAAGLLGEIPGHGGAHAGAALAVGRLAAAATALGLAQAALEAALRYAQQRTTFGKPISQHQAIQLKLADMATLTTAARLLTYEAGARDLDETWLAMAKVAASEAACDVTLGSMRIHGGYGYTAEFPVERYYRDAARLLVYPTENDAERRDLARRLADAAAAPRRARGDFLSPEER